MALTSAETAPALVLSGRKSFATTALAMCTLLIAVHVFPDFPLVVAANRDEFLGRPATGPFVWPARPPVVAPKDEQAGGSWLGFGAGGLFVGVTNRWRFPVDPGRKSRGALVMDALAAPNARALAADLAGLDGRLFNAFHLVYADREAAFLTASDGERATQAPLPPGVHVVTEQGLLPEDVPRVRRVLSRWNRDVAGRASPDFAALQALLAEHGPDPREGPCVHIEGLAYGTRSSAILALGSSLAETRFFWAEGPPCRTPFEERPDLVAALAAS
jgi:uncharacterized protein with NRDE domain